MPGLLTRAITLPIIGAVLLMLVPNRDGSKDGLIRYLALGVSLVTFAVTLVLWAGFDAASADPTTGVRGGIAGSMRARMALARPTAAYNCSRPTSESASSHPSSARNSPS